LIRSSLSTSIPRCRYNERLNTETGESKTPRIHGVARVTHAVNLVLVVTLQETVGLVRRSRNQSTGVYYDACDREESGCGEGVVWVCGDKKNVYVTLYIGRCSS
jgi:hypothetical protein